MKIQDKILSELHRLGGKKSVSDAASKKGLPPKGGRGEDRVDLSSLKGEMELFLSHLEQLPDIREKALELKTAIDSNRYAPDTMGVADAMVSAAVDKLPR